MPQARRFRSAMLNPRAGRVLGLILPLPAVFLASARGADVTSSWTTATTGTWTNAARWSSAFFPNNGNGGFTYAGVINAVGSAYTVTLNSDITINDFTLNSANATVSLTSGSFSVVSSARQINAGTFLLNGGVINGGSISIGGTGTLVFANINTNRFANNALLVGDLNISQANGKVRFQTGSSFSGNANLTGSGTILDFEQTGTLDNKTINMDGSGASLAVDGTNTLTLGSNAVVRGIGSVGGQIFGGGGQTVINNGRITADNVNSNGLLIVANSFTNNGTLSATVNGQLLINSANWTNAGTLLVASATATLTTGGTWTNSAAIRVNGGTLNAGGTISTAGLTANFARTGGTVNMTGTFNNAGNTLTFTSTTGDWNLKGGVINGGTIVQSGGNLVFTTDTGNRLANNALLSGDLNLNVAGGFLRLQSGAGFSGNANLSADNTTLDYEQVGSLDNKTINLDANNVVLGVEGGTTLTLGSNAFVRGRGQVGNRRINLVTANGLINSGTITCDVSGGNLSVRPTNFTNNGTLVASGGGRLDISSLTTWSNTGTLLVADANSQLYTDGNWTNTGAIRVNEGILNVNGVSSLPSLTSNFARSGGTVNLDGTFNNTGSTLTLNANTGDWIHRGIINGGTIVQSGGNLLGGSGILANNALLVGDLHFSQFAGSIRLQTGASFTGDAFLTDLSTILYFEQTGTLDNKTINLGGINNIDTCFLDIPGNNTLTLGTNGVIRGRGAVGDLGFGVGVNGLINNGRISADINGGSILATLTTRPQNFTNNGTLSASGGGGLVIGGGTTNWSNTGTLSVADASSTVRTAGNWTHTGTISLNGGTLNLGGTVSTTNLTNHFTRSGGTVNMTGTFNNAGNTLTLTSTTGDWVLNGGVINGGTILQSGGNLLYAVYDFINTNRLANNALLVGDLNLSAPGAFVRLQTGATFSGNANLGDDAVLDFDQTGTLDNKTINMDGLNDRFGIDGNTTLTLGSNAVVRGSGTFGGQVFVGGANTLINNGRITADMSTTGVELNIAAHTFTNNGTLSTTGGATFSFDSDTTWSNTGTLVVNGGVLNLGGTVSTSGLTSKFVRSGGTVNIVGNLNNAGNTLTFNATTGDWYLKNGTISGGSIVQSGGNPLFTAYGGKLANNALLVGDLNLNLDGAFVQLQTGASFSGNANISGNDNFLFLEYTHTIDNKTINMDGFALGVGSTAPALAFLGATTLTLGTNGVVRGRGTIGQHFSGGVSGMVNNGRITADIPGSTLDLVPENLTNNGTLSASGGATLSVGSFINGSGRLRAASGGAVLVTNVTGNLNDSAADGVDSRLRLAGTYTINQQLNVTNRATVNLMGSWTKSATIDASGRIIFDYTGASPLPTLEAQLRTGLNGGAWDGPGINSSAAHVTSSTAVGSAEASQIFGVNGGVFSGESVDNTAVLIKYTWYGDTDLNGKVDGADYARIDTTFNNETSLHSDIGGWFNGDFDYNGKVDGADYALIDAAFNSQSSQLRPGTMPVPEPAAALGLTVLAGCALRPRQRRRGQ